jgi:topoisomerase-4 subunit A
VRRTEYRLERIARRLEVLDGYLVAYLNLDEVIRIIREEDEPKAVLIETFELTDVQADAILNMRLRALRKLEEMEIRKEHKALKAEQKSLRALLKDKKKRWQVIAGEIREVRKQFGTGTPLGKRRTEIGDAPEPLDVPLEAMVVREPITVICSEKGWIRAAKGHLEDTSNLKFKDGDRGRFALHAETTDKLLIFGTNGRFYTLGCDKLPGGRGHGEPVRLMIGLGNEDDIVDILVHQPGRRLLVAALSGRGFIVPEDEVVAATRNGKQVLNVPGDDEAAALAVIPEKADHVAVIGNNRKLLVFSLKEMPEMTRGRGVILQRYKEGQLNDIKAFRLKEGLNWQAGRQGTRSETDLKAWRGERAQAGRMAPRGFNANNRFTS